MIGIGADSGPPTPDRCRRRPQEQIATGHGGDIVHRLSRSLSAILIILGSMSLATRCIGLCCPDGLRCCGAALHVQARI